MAKYFLGIDQGTTSTTAILIDENWNVAGKANIEHKQYYPKQGWVEHDPMELFECCRKAADMALKSIPGASPSDIVCMGIDHQGETALVWDKKTGLPIYNAIVWLDRRTADFAEMLKEKHGDYIKKVTGLWPDSAHGGPKIAWILDHVEGAREKAERGELMAGTLNTWLIYKFTGDKSFTTEGCSAARLAILDLKESKYDKNILDIYNIPEKILPPIMNCNEIFGYTSPDVFYGCKIPIAGSISDSKAALIGGAGTLPGTFKTSYGTGCFMALVTGNEIIKSNNGLVATCCWKLDGVSTYDINASCYVAGAAIQWLKNGINIIDSVSQIEPMVNSVPDTRDVFFVPAFSGLASPYWDQYARGAFIGLTGGVNRNHLVRAVAESIAYQVTDCYRAILLDYGKPLTIMTADGGLVDNSFIMQFQADMLGIPVEVPEEKETAAFGAACLAAFTMGAIGSIADVRKVIKIKKVYEPKMSEDEREARFARWHKAVERCRNWAES